MSSISSYSDYDRFAWIYNNYWGDLFSKRMFPTLEKLMLAHLPTGARLLDLCCGTGHLAQALAAQGYQVTGIDGSEEMVRFARENAPTAEFVVGDARSFELPPTYHGVISTFDSLNHIMSLEELKAAFCNVFRALVESGIFLFDLNMEEGYWMRWRGSFGVAEDDSACIVRTSYESKDRLGRYRITMFRLEENLWQRSDLTLLQRCYSEEEVQSALESVGFAEIRAYDAQEDLGLFGDIGRTFFVCRRFSGGNSS